MDVEGFENFDWYLLMCIYCVEESFGDFEVGVFGEYKGIFDCIKLVIEIYVIIYGDINKGLSDNSDGNSDIILVFIYIVLI